MFMGKIITETEPVSAATGVIWDHPKSLGVPDLILKCPPGVWAMTHRQLCAGEDRSLPITDPLTSGQEAWDGGFVLPPTCDVISQRSLNPTEALFFSSVKWKLLLPLIIFSDPHIL